MIKPFAVLLLILVLLTVLAQPSAARSFVYVTNYGDGTVSQFQANPNGTLTPLNPPRVKAYLRCHRMAIDPKGRYLYVLSAREWKRRDCLISQFRIGPDGRLSPLSPPRVVMPYDRRLAPYLIFSEPSGRFIYVLDYGGIIVPLRIQRSGGLAPLLPPLTAATNIFEQNDFSLVYDRQHSVFFVAGQTRMINELLGHLYSFSVNKDGSLRLGGVEVPPVGNPKFGSLPPEKIFLSHQGRYAFVLYTEFTSEIESRHVIAQFRTQPSGRLAPANAKRVSLPGIPRTLIMDPLSRYFYVFVDPPYREGHPVHANKTILIRYVLRSDGTLGRHKQQILTVPKTLFDLYFEPYSLFSPVFDPSGHTLYLLTQKGVRSFHVKPDGSVVSLLPRNVPAGRGPLGMIYVRR